MKKPLIALGLLAVLALTANGAEQQAQQSQSHLTDDDHAYRLVQACHHGGFIDDLTAALNSQYLLLQARRTLAVSQGLPRFVTVNKSFEKGGI